ncbi:threonine/serine exporter family protein [Brevibacillus fluminis]|uniref:Threonine/serine exporter n=1 Tax=Brevibacillus fluminis TaxID=511487 RepID=A0A3M8D4F3_9BACL|nr:threonine/serine exporter family protein [Brevibacillus fluminis]RNB82768.1 threonine/serine exporter [Brevibacillus fluminis]
MPWWQGLSFSLMSTVAYCILFNVPIRTLFAGGMVGMTGWVVFQVMTVNGASLTLATFGAATTVSLLSQFLSIFLRVPSTNFSVSGIIPLVPGSKAYKAMLAFVNGENLDGVTLVTLTAFAAGAIAAGLILGISIFSVWKGIVTRYAAKRAKAT